MRSRFKFLAVLISLTLVTGVASASIKAGATCSKVGATSTSAGKKYTCIKSGKKLVWNKGVTVIKPVPTVTPTPEPSPSASPTPTPTPTPTVVPVPFEPKTLDDLILHPESISYWAWTKSSQQISSSLNVGPKATVILGPNTLLPTKFTQTAIDQVTRLYVGFIRPSAVTIIYYNFQDISWAQQEWAKISLSPEANKASSLCPEIDKCWSAVAEIDLKGNGLLLIASKDPASSSLDHTSGAGEAHEYTHAIQSTQFLGTSKESRAYCCIKAYMPWWMVEGNAAFTQAAATYSLSYLEYLEERKRNTSNLIANTNKVFTKQWFENYLDIASTDEWNKPENSDRMYDVGFLLNEALASIYGPNINLQLFKDVANGKTWEQAFEANTGISWSVALPKLAAILSGVAGH